MSKENNFKVVFTEEFVLCLDRIQRFFGEQDNEALNWWYSKEEEIIDFIENLLSVTPYAGLAVESGPFTGLRQITYGKSRHTMLNYVIFYVIHENDHQVDVINILPSRTKRARI